MSQDVTVSDTDTCFVCPSSKTGKRAKETEETAMKLYFTPGACSLATHIVLREAEFTFDLDQVDLATKKTKSGADFTQLNLKAQVPMLQLDDGQRLTEVPVVLQYIADRKPEADLVPPAGTMERYRVLEWLNFVTSELHKTFSPMVRQNTPEEYKKITKENIAAKFGYLDRHLAGRLYLMGDKFSVADAYCFTVVNWSNFLNIDLTPWANLKAYMGRVAARPKVHEALKAEGLAT
jgi:glutathione S-transferase